MNKETHSFLSFLLVGMKMTAIESAWINAERKSDTADRLVKEAEASGRDSDISAANRAVKVAREAVKVAREAACAAWQSKGVQTRFGATV